MHRGSVSCHCILAGACTTTTTGRCRRSGGGGSRYRSSRSRCTCRKDDFFSLPSRVGFSPCSLSFFSSFSPIHFWMRQGTRKEKSCRVACFHPLQTPSRLVHQSPPIPPSSSQTTFPPLHASSQRTGEAIGEEASLEVARDALLQFNVMVARGVEPDALMYTALIATMARAGLEWQAYKLFSRMIEGKVCPLPETYIALRDATSPRRRQLREDIQGKVEEAMATFPDVLAERELARRRQEDIECWRTFMSCIEGEEWPTASHALLTDDPGESAPPLPQKEEEEEEEKERKKKDFSGAGEEKEEENEGTKEGQRRGDDEASSPGCALDSSGTPLSSSSSSSFAPLATVKIRHPREVWETAQLVETLRQDERGRAKGKGRERLRVALEQLHEEELRIFLTIHRQLRHGTKETLVERILGSVEEERLEAMLQRRGYYFRSVEKILKNDLEVVKKASRSDAPPSSSSSSRSATLSAEERHAMEPELLYTPWGFLRKPARLPPSNVPTRPPPLFEAGESAIAAGEGGPHSSSTDPSSSSSSSVADASSLSPQFLRLPLSHDELSLVRAKAACGDVEELPESLLRRYAYMFRLRWRRQEPSGGREIGHAGGTALWEVVQWHVMTFFDVVADPSSSSSSSSSTALLFTPSPAATTAVRRQKETEGMRRTLENYEAFRVMAQRTQNMQVVDHKEINLHLHRIRREARAAAQQAAEMSRREAHKDAAASLPQRATTWDDPVPGGEPPERDAFSPASFAPPFFAHGRGKVGGDALGRSPPASRLLGWFPASSTSTGMHGKHDADAEGTTFASVPDSTERAAVVDTKSASEKEEEEELPPWELTTREEEFDFATGRFGDPKMGTYRELSDSTIRLLPQHEAEKKWRVDADLLPSSLKRVAREVTAQQEKEREEVERVYQQRRQYTKYRKWDGLLSRAQEKRRQKKEAQERTEEDAKEAEKRRKRRQGTERDRLSVVGEEEEEEGGRKSRRDHTSSFSLEGDLPLLRRRPIPPGRRLSQLLRKGEHRQRVSASLRQQFSSTT